MLEYDQERTGLNEDIRISVEFWTHPKTVKLERRLGIEGPKHLQMLWSWVAKNKPDGDLTGMDDEDIEIAASWQGDEGLFIKTLIDLKWIDSRSINESSNDRSTNEIYSIHDWQDRNPWAANADERSNKARFSRLAKTYPHIHKQLLEKGYCSISKDKYEQLTSVNESSNDRLTNVKAALTPAPSSKLQAPAPTPTYTPKKNTSADSIYGSYLSIIDPLQKTRGRATDNIAHYLKTYHHDDLVSAIKNYSTIIRGRERKYRKDPANFFGKQEKFFIDYLPGKFIPPENEITRSRAPTSSTPTPTTYAQCQDYEKRQQIAELERLKHESANENHCTQGSNQPEHSSGVEERLTGN